MTKERVESIRKIVLPFIAKKLKEIDYEGLGESDAKEFTNDFNEILNLAEDAIEQDCISRKFEGIVVEYPPADLCIYPEYKGKPYFSIKYEENGEHIGFGTYNPEVLTRYLQEYFISDIQPKTGHCKDCKYFEYDSVANLDGIPLIVAHEICSKWGDGCKTSEDGYCFLFEPKEERSKAE